MKMNKFIIKALKKFTPSTDYIDSTRFRCGTCFEYPAFNPLTTEILKIRIRPLIAMECTIIADRYMVKIWARSIREVPEFKR